VVSPRWIAYATLLPLKYRRYFLRLIPASLFVCSQIDVGLLEIIPIILTSPTTFITGYVEYIMILLTGFLGIRFRYSYNLVPLKMRSTYSGLTDNNIEFTFYLQYLRKSVSDSCRIKSNWVSEILVNGRGPLPDSIIPFSHRKSKIGRRVKLLT